jgi:hypothetical protein
MTQNDQGYQRPKRNADGSVESRRKFLLSSSTTVYQINLNLISLILALAFFLYVLIGIIIGSPIFGSDEYAYFIQGKYFGQQAKLILLDPYLQQIASPLFLFILHWITKLVPVDITVALRILHSAEYCLTAYVLSRLFGEICGKKYLLAGIAALLLMPGAYYMLAVMPEIELLLISSMVGYVLIVKFPQQYYKSSAYAGVLLGLALLLKPHSLAIITTALLTIFISGFLGLPRSSRIKVPIKSSFLLIGVTYITFLLMWRICENSWEFDPSVLLGLKLYGNQLASNASNIFYKLVDTLFYFAAHIFVLFLIFTPAFMFIYEHAKKAIIEFSKGRREEFLSIGNRAEMAGLFVFLMLVTHVMMSAYFTAGAAALNVGEEFRLQGRYLGSAIIFLPFLYYSWIEKQEGELRRPVVFFFLISALVCYLWVFSFYKIFPWDHPLLYGFFSYPNHYGWGFESSLPFVGKWLFWFLIAGYLIILFKKAWIRQFVLAQLFVVMLVGSYQMINWVNFHTKANANLSQTARALSKLVGSGMGRGVYISNERYGSMSYVLYGLASAPKVLVKQLGDTIMESDVEGYEWVLLGGNFVPRFNYSSEISIERFNLYMISSKPVAREHER